MTIHSPEFMECEQATDWQSLPRLHRPANADTLAAGLAYMASQHQDGHWNASHCSDFYGLTSACIFAFLGDVPSALFGHRLRQRVDESLDWLLRAQTPAGGWRGSSGDEETAPTAWTILALKKNGRSVPPVALDWLGRCRARDGGFLRRPGQYDGSALVETAVAVQALGCIDIDAEKFLCARMQSEGAEPAQQLQAAASILDCDKAIVPFPLLNLACQVTADSRPATARDRALLLRCLLRLRLTRAWKVAAELRAMQLADGSWPGAAGDHVIATAAASSALALVEAQPGLYFGSDWPRPQRLHTRS